MEPLPTSDQRQWNVGPEGERAGEYKRWRMGLGEGLVVDIDQVEFRTNPDGSYRIAAIIELSKVEGEILNPGAYLSTVVRNRKRQLDLIEAVAWKLDVPAWYVIFTEGLSDVYVLPITTTRKWHHMSIAEWRSVLARL